MKRNRSTLPLPYGIPFAMHVLQLIDERIAHWEKFQFVEARGYVLHELEELRYQVIKAAE